MLLRQQHSPGEPPALLADPQHRQGHAPPSPASLREREEALAAQVPLREKAALGEGEVATRVVAQTHRYPGLEPGRP